MQIAYFQSQISRYVERHRKKNGKEDLLKALHFLEKYMELEYPEVLELDISTIEGEPTSDYTNQDPDLKLKVLVGEDWEGKIHAIHPVTSEGRGKTMCGDRTRQNRYLEDYYSVTCVHCKEALLNAGE